MHIGIHGPLSLADASLIRDLGVDWAKIGVDIGDPLTEPDRRQLDTAQELGLRLVVDLRTSSQYINACQLAAMNQMRAEGTLETAGTQELTLAERTRIMVANARAVYEVAYRPMLDSARELVAARPECEDWEFWGESACPWVSQGVFSDPMQFSTYPAFLRLVSGAIREVRPECRVWSGGNGMDLQATSHLALLSAGGGDHIDVLNWHPYFIKIRDRSAADTYIRRGYEQVTEKLRSLGQRCWLGATEWGYPTQNVDASSAEAERILRSHVFPEGSQPLLWSDAPTWYDTDLQAMQTWGFQVVVVHSLRDEPTPHPYWGQRCGLLDTEGRYKSTWDVVQRWAWAGRETPIFEDVAKVGAPAIYEEAASG